MHAVDAGSHRTQRAGLSEADRRSVRPVNLGHSNSIEHPPTAYIPLSAGGGWPGDGGTAAVAGPCKSQKEVLPEVSYLSRQNAVLAHTIYMEGMVIALRSNHPALSPDLAYASTAQVHEQETSRAAVGRWLAGDGQVTSVHVIRRRCGNKLNWRQSVQLGRYPADSPPFLRGAHRQRGLSDAGDPGRRGLL